MITDSIKDLNNDHTLVPSTTAFDRIRGSACMGLAGIVPDVVQTPDRSVLSAWPPGWTSTEPTNAPWAYGTSLSPAAPLSSAECPLSACQNSP